MAIGAPLNSPDATDAPQGGYGDKVLAVEPGGNEAIPVEARHGAPRGLFWTWTAPNLEFATIFVGVISILYFGLSFWQAVAAMAIGNLLGAAAHFLLSAEGPLHGVPQMVLGRLAFGYRGNILPATFMAVMCGVGWFATNSVSGAFALSTLFGITPLLGLVIIVVAQTAFAFFGHNLVQRFERIAAPVLAVIFVVGAVIIFGKSHVSAPSADGGFAIGGFLLTMGAAFGYTAGWTPYAADYTRYLPPTVSKVKTGLFASSGLFLSCTFLMVVGAASVTIGDPVSDNPTEAFTANLPSLVADLTLLAIAVGAVAANAINVYSGSMAFLAMGFRLPVGLQRALVTVFFGVVGFLVAWWALADAAASYEAFLLLVAYWIGPWLGVVFADRLLRKEPPTLTLLYDTRYANWGGVAAFVLGLLASVLLFCNQERFVGYVVRAIPELGDIGAFVGFALAFGLYLILARGRVAQSQQPRS
ncbi:cytosine permease [Gordonia rubripertincta]|uniref:Cytosine permease n=2 Tax=Gordonia rubripertincta TaxID=36822 RepID=A0AAW4G559_GORRU|nr:cytosine permease [Gordonia rubripertincta]ASR04301.1 putative allantoin permease [Gordonia rubripertincta]MBM7278557.1 cytosine permease [Gordonia rubripertincta]MDG6779284.1 cytosine permease [Gordonia rubripertincta]NKY62595.1 cytosine permease [Gordonia rubripertincta]QMU23057.1 cytosine permease [Gordonia rubripertincta]